jgi:glycosyltransferase involved in cell wall biosynthesis
MKRTTLMNKIPKKVLIIAYYWPPAGGPGVQRWLKFVKYLPDFGIEPHVYVPENPSYPIVDFDLENQINPKAIVIKQKIFEPFALAKLISKNSSRKMSSGIITNAKKQSLIEKIMLWIRGNLFIPDARFFWVKPSVKFLETYIKSNDIQTIITTGPPHSLHLIGLGLQKKIDLNWIADFRDPWTTIGYQKELKLTVFAQKKHRILEQKVLNAANHILVTSPTTKSEFELHTNKPITVITNGFDVEISSPENLDEMFTISHIGSLLSNRNPKILWEVLKELTLENQLFANKFKLRLIGKISPEILDAISVFGLDSFLENLGYLSHQECLAFQQKSQLLLLIEIDSPETRCIIPGKLFEYMMSKRPIIAIGPKKSDIEGIINKTNTGFFIDYTQKTLLKNQILNAFEAYQKKELFSNAINLDEYSRKNLTEKLVNLLNN